MTEPKRKPMTPSQRAATSEQRRVAAGARRINAVVAPETVERLERLRVSGMTRTEAIEAGLRLLATERGLV